VSTNPYCSYVDYSIDIEFSEDGGFVHEVTGVLIPRVGDTIMLKLNDYRRADEAVRYKVVDVIWEYTTDVEYDDGSHHHPYVKVHVKQLFAANEIGPMTMVGVPG
jgi:hypothetical protein